VWRPRPRSLPQAPQTTTRDTASVGRRDGAAAWRHGGNGGEARTPAAGLEAARYNARTAVAEIEHAAESSQETASAAETQEAAAGTAGVAAKAAAGLQAVRDDMRTLAVAVSHTVESAAAAAAAVAAPIVAAATAMSVATASARPFQFLGDPKVIRRGS